MGPLDVFSTCPPSVEASTTAAMSGSSYRHRIAEIARWSEAAGCKGILVYTDNRLVDPWLAAQLIIEATQRLEPLVAVQPAYMHPYTVAKMVSSFAHLHGRKICLNMVAGGFKRDLEALKDFTPHDQRYDRLVEYSKIIDSLVFQSIENLALSFEGDFYAVDGLKLQPRVPEALQPEFFVSGSSEAGAKAALELDAVAVQYPQPAGSYFIESFPTGAKRGIRVGMIARETTDEAWRIAEERFPPDRRGEIAHGLTLKVSDSQWHKDLSEWPEATQDPDTVYWLRPFRSYRTFCPYLVGSFHRVAEEIATYLNLGFDRFILDVPPDAHELACSRRVFDAALDMVA